MAADEKKPQDIVAIGRVVQGLDQRLLAILVRGGDLGTSLESLLD